jgi:CheY-like chemotaxis protein
LRLTIQDTGHGMTPEVMDRIFEPYYTTKEVGQGTGMGLAIVHGIVTNHNGAITVQSRLGVGTTFEVYFPRHDEKVERIDRPEAPLSSGTGSILFVDDEETLALLGREMLRSLGYDVTAMMSSIDALEVFRHAPHRFDLVITDQTMPNMTGEMLACKLRQIRPDIPIILCTGFSHIMDAEKADAQDIDAFLMKPATAYDLGTTIQQLLAAQTVD